MMPRATVSRLPGWKVRRLHAARDVEHEHDVARPGCGCPGSRRQLGAGHRRWSPGRVPGRRGGRAGGAGARAGDAGADARSPERGRRSAAAAGADGATTPGAQPQGNEEEQRATHGSASRIRASVLMHRPLDEELARRSRRDCGGARLQAGRRELDQVGFGQQAVAAVEVRKRSPVAAGQRPQELGGGQLRAGDCSDSGQKSRTTLATSS